jgi:hypothetical protein
MHTDITLAPILSHVTRTYDEIYGEGGPCEHGYGEEGEEGYQCEEG